MYVLLQLASVPMAYGAIIVYHRAAVTEFDLRDPGKVDTSAIDLEVYNRLRDTPWQCNSHVYNMLCVGLLEPRPPPGMFFPRLKPGQGEAMATDTNVPHVTYRTNRNDLQQQ
jgi:hypothetical protein